MPRLFRVSILGVLVQFFMTDIILASPTKNEIEEEQVKKIVEEYHKYSSYIPHVQDIPEIKSLEIETEKILSHFSIKHITPKVVTRATTFERGELDIIVGARCNPVEWLESTLRDVNIHIQRLKNHIYFLEMEYKIKRSIYEDHQTSLRGTQNSFQANASTSIWGLVNPVNLVKKEAVKLVWGSSSNTTERFDQLDYDGLYIIYSFLYRIPLLDEKLRDSRPYHQEREAYSKGDYSLLLKWKPNLLEPERVQLIGERERSSDALFWEIKRLIISDLINKRRSEVIPPLNEEVVKIEELLSNDKRDLYELLTKRRGIKTKLSRIQKASNVILDENYFTFEEKVHLELKLVKEQILNLVSRIRRREDDLKKLYTPKIEALKEQLEDLLRDNSSQEAFSKRQKNNKTYPMILREYKALHEQLKQIDTHLEAEGFHLFKGQEDLIRPEESEKEKKVLKETENLDMQSAASSAVLPMTRERQEQISQELFFCLIGKKNGNKKVVRSGKKMTTDIITLVLEEAPKLITEAYACFEEEIVILGLPAGEILKLKEPLQATLSDVIENIIPYQFDRKEGRIILRPIVTLDLDKVAQKVETLSLANFEKLQELIKAEQDELQKLKKEEECYLKKLEDINKNVTDLKQKKLQQAQEQDHPLNLKEVTVARADMLEEEARRRIVHHEAFVRQSTLKRRLEADEDNLAKQVESLSIVLTQKEEEIQSLLKLVDFEKTITQLRNKKHADDITVTFTAEEKERLETSRALLATQIADQEREQAKFKNNLFHQIMLEPAKEALKKMGRFRKQRLRIKQPLVAYNHYVDGTLNIHQLILFEAYKSVFQTDQLPLMPFRIFEEDHEIWTEFDIPGLAPAKLKEELKQQADLPLQDKTRAQNHEEITLNKTRAEVDVIHSDEENLIDDFEDLTDKTKADLQQDSQLKPGMNFTQGTEPPLVQESSEVTNTSKVEVKVAEITS
ncbi:hypothetical protein IM40_01445 [Candidatus Paracaedimonas acanthamoebae]|nr:hypothetical protein IM40_01445 [Candidatus Paracaedimonas acanthamoebae]